MRRSITIPWKFIIPGIIILMLCYLIAFPLILIIRGAFWSGSPQTPGGWFTLDHIARSYTNPRFHQAFIDLFTMAIGTTVIALIIGVLLAWILARTDTPGRSTLEILVAFPLFLSAMANAISWYILGAPKSGIINVFFNDLFHIPPFVNLVGAIGVIWVMGLSYSPYVFLFCIGCFRYMDPSLEEASTVLGGSWSKTFYKITLPMLLPAVFTSAILVFLIAAGEFAVPGVLGVPGGFLPVTITIWESLAWYPADYGAASALSLGLLVICVTSLILYRKMMKKNVTRFATITGRGYRPRLIKLGKWKYLTLIACLLYVLFAVILPYIALTICAFTKYMARHYTLDMFTLQNFQRIFAMKITMPAITNTLILAIVGSTVTVLFGIIISYLVLRTKWHGLGLIDYISMMPIGIPGIILGVGMLWAYYSLPLPIPIYGTIVILVMAALVHSLPLAVRPASAMLVQIHTELEDSSKILGASTLHTLRKITIPLVKSSVLANWTLLFVMMVREISTIILLITPRTLTLSVLMWDVMESGEVNIAASLCLIQAILILVVILIAQKAFNFSLMKSVR